MTKGLHVLHGVEKKYGKIQYTANNRTRIENVDSNNVEEKKNMTSHIAEEKKESLGYKHVFAILFLLLFASLTFTSFYYVNKRCNFLENRIKIIEHDLHLSKQFIENTTRFFNGISYVAYKDHGTVSSEQGDTETKFQRVRRQAQLNDKANENQNRKNSERIERTLHSLRREMFSLNDRLRYLMRYSQDSISQQRQGPSGPQGKPGKVGPRGPSGIDGRDGFHGVRGEKGGTGLQGLPGPIGPFGKDGIPGINGIPGLPGYIGSKGNKGESGRDGSNGANGRAGSVGRTGPPGRTGSPGTKGEVGECDCMKPTPLGPPVGNFDDVPKPQLVYTIWGSSTCPYTSEQIYSGQTTSGRLYKKNVGYSGSNPICLPNSKRSRRKKRSDADTVVIKNNRTSVNTGNLTTTASPTTTTASPTTTTASPTTTTASPTTTTASPTTTKGNFFVPPYADLVGTRKYIPCALCHVEGKSISMMIPSKTQCPSSWQFEYQGYLMNYHHGNRQSEVLCVYDQALGVSPSSDSNIRRIIAKYMNHIKVDCDSFACPPFNEELLKCVVCSK